MLLQLIEVTNEVDFRDVWNKMSSNVGHVSIISHSSPWSFTFDKSSVVWVSVKNSWYHGLSKAKDDVYVEDLDFKNVDLRIIGCNSGHKDVIDNLASAFATVTSGDIYACDGNMKSGWFIFSANHGDSWGVSKGGSFKDYVQNYGSGNREPDGLYQYR